MTVDLAEIEGWVRAEFAAAAAVRRGRHRGGRRPSHPRPGRLHAELAGGRSTPKSPSRWRSSTSPRGTAGSSSSALRRRALRRWSPDGERLALLATGDEGVPTAWVVDLSDGDASTAQVTHRLPDIAGAVENVAWSPDGIGCAWSSRSSALRCPTCTDRGRCPVRPAAESWRPIVSPAGDSGRRMLHVWDPATGTVEVICPAANVWEAGWYGAGPADRAGHGCCRRRCLVRSDACKRSASTVVPIRCIAATCRWRSHERTPSGDRWSVLSARASDRGLLAGDLIVGSSTSAGRRYDTADVDVTAHYWLDEHRIGFAGLRGLATVFGVLDVLTGTVDELFSHRRSEWEISAGGRCALPWRSPRHRARTA